MNTIDLKDHVRRAIRTSWHDFEREHPLLAQAIDPEMLVEQAMASIADDPDYAVAMDQAAAIGVGAAALEAFVDRFVAGWLKKVLP